MDPTDKQLEQAEVDAVPHSREEEKPKESLELERAASTGSNSTATSSSTDYNPQFHRLQSRNTELDLERNRTNVSRELSRIETQRLQHSYTVGESIKSRPSKSPLPAFGAGKPYPPPLPNRDDYVVEFDGPDDPMYPKNWSLNTKYVF